MSNVSKRGHNDRYHDVEEYERKVRKRRARLISATEESFTHIRRMREEVLTGQFSFHHLWDTLWVIRDTFSII